MKLTSAACTLFGHSDLQHHSDSRSEFQNRDFRATFLPENNLDAIFQPDDFDSRTQPTAPAIEYQIMGNLEADLRSQSSKKAP